MTSISAPLTDNTLRWLHVYQPDRIHGPATIVGNRAALEDLRATLDRLLADPTPGLARVTTDAHDASGEVYQVHIKRVAQPTQIGQLPYGERS